MDHLRRDPLRLIRKGVTFHPILKTAPDYADRIVVCTAPSKTFNLAGMKTSNIVIHNKDLQKQWIDLLDNKLSMGGPSTLGLTAMIAAYTEGEDWLEQVKDYIDGNFAYIDAFLKEHLPKAHMIPSEGPIWPGSTLTATYTATRRSWRS